MRCSGSAGAGQRRHAEGPVAGRSPIEGAREEVRFSDHFGNDTRLISIEGEPRLISIEAAGEVETMNTAGVIGHIAALRRCGCSSAKRR